MFQDETRQVKAEAKRTCSTSIWAVGSHSDVPRFLCNSLFHLFCVCVCVCVCVCLREISCFLYCYQNFLRNIKFVFFYFYFLKVFNWCIIALPYSTGASARWSVMT